MNEELLIHCSAQETRVAVMVNGILEDLHIERRAQRGLVGNVYKGKVMRVLPGMQSAFIDIGLERTAFLHVHDIYTARQDEVPINPLNICSMKESLSSFRFPKIRSVRKAQDLQPPFRLPATNWSICPKSPISVCLNELKMKLSATDSKPSLQP